MDGIAIVGQLRDTGRPIHRFVRDVFAEISVIEVSHDSIEANCGKERPDT